MKTPTDLQILNFIYDNYYNVFASYGRAKDRQSKVYVPINSDDIGKKLKVDGDIIFGRLYYHLNKKYSYSKDDTTIVEFF